MNSYENLILEALDDFVPNDKKGKVTYESTLREDLGMDSISLLGLFVHLEHKVAFDIAKVPEDVDFADINTVNDIIVLINNIKSNV